MSLSGALLCNQHETRSKRKNRRHIQEKHWGCHGVAFVCPASCTFYPGTTPCLNGLFPVSENRSETDHLLLFGESGLDIEFIKSTFHLLLYHIVVNKWTCRHISVDHESIQVQFNFKDSVCGFFAFEAAGLNKQETSLHMEDKSRKRMTSE